MGLTAEERAALARKAHEDAVAGEAERIRGRMTATIGGGEGLRKVDVLDRGLDALVREVAELRVAEGSREFRGIAHHYRREATDGMEVETEERLLPDLGSVWWSITFAAVFLFIGVVFTRAMWGVPAAAAFVMGCLIGGLWAIVFWARALLVKNRKPTKEAP